MSGEVQQLTKYWEIMKINFSRIRFLDVYIFRAVNKHHALWHRFIAIYLQRFWRISRHSGLTGAVLCRLIHIIHS